MVKKWQRKTEKRLKWTKSNKNDEKVERKFQKEAKKSENKREK